MTTTGLVLEYLWTAHYADGSFFDEPDDDESQLVAGKSAFYDALARQSEHGPIVRFALVSVVRVEEPGRASFISVDLKTGRFEVDGAQVIVGDHEAPSAEVAPLRLEFFRRHIQRMNAQLEEKSHEVRYFLGWSATIPVPGQEPREVKNILGVA